MKCPECGGHLIQRIELDIWLCEECPYAETQALHNRRQVDNLTEPTPEVQGLQQLVAGTEEQRPEWITRAVDTIAPGDTMATFTQVTN